MRIGISHIKNGGADIADVLKFAKENKCANLDYKRVDELKEILKLCGYDVNNGI